jgi:transposase
MAIAVLGIDLGKNLCSLAGFDAAGQVVLRRRLRRGNLLPFVADLPSCTIAMEACCGAHHLGRHFIAQGHSVRLMSPEYVRPYVKAQKNDDRDAEAIAEAATRPTMRFVTMKSEHQLDVQTLHRVRERLVLRRTSLINQLRAILLERGVTFGQGRARLARELAGIALDGISPRIQSLVQELRAEWEEIEARIKSLDTELAELARTDEAARRLAEIPGVGKLTATALVAAVGDGSSFAKGRDLAAWIGLVPRQATTGGKPKLLGISKRGNAYLRRLFVHCARATLPYLSVTDTPIGRWLKALLERSHRNVVVVALANKLVRIAWAVLALGRRYSASFAPRLAGAAEVSASG